MTYYQRTRMKIMRAFSAILTFIFCISLHMPICVLSARAETKAVSKAECVLEVNSRRVLYEEHGDLRLPMASTTKILTCITVLELCENLQQKIVIPEKAVGIEGSSVYLKAGDCYTIEELLYGLMLRSGNDCATALALSCCGNVEEFAYRMNLIAQKAGALSSNFENPHGLPSSNHYTTARDLALITAYAMQNPTFREIVSTKYYQPRQWKNKNKLLSTYEGALGVKTGYTKEAGRCLVSAAKQGDMTLICVVLGCPSTYERTTTLFNDAFAQYSLVRLLGANEPIEGGVAQKDYYYPLLKEEKEYVSIKTIPYMDKKKQEIIGQFEIYLAKRLLFSGNLYKL